jgi:hypothetical protein
MTELSLAFGLYERLAGWQKDSSDRFLSGLISEDFRIEELSDVRILALANLQMPESQQETLHELLEKNGEGELTKLEKKYLDELMEIHNDALLTKAKAMRIAVERGLMKPLSSE